MLFFFNEKSYNLKTINLFLFIIDRKYYLKLKTDVKMSLKKKQSFLQNSQLPVLSVPCFVQINLR